jgi:membrane protein DedA with SNARE-associated domain
MAKLDWLTWWAGRHWGPGIIRMLTTSQQAQRWARRGREADPRVVQAAVVLAMLPGVPTAVVFALAGWVGMRLTTFLLLDLVGAFAMTGLIAILGYGLGQHAVDVVLLIDRYASAASLTLIGLAASLPVLKRLLRRSSQRRASAPSGHLTVHRTR